MTCNLSELSRSSNYLLVLVCYLTSDLALGLLVSPPEKHEQSMNLKPLLYCHSRVDCWHSSRLKHRSPPLVHCCSHLRAFYLFSLWHFSFFSNLCAFFFSLFASHSSGFCWLQSRSDRHGRHLLAFQLSDFQLRSPGGRHGWNRVQTDKLLNFTFHFFCPSFQLRTASRLKNVGVERFGGKAQHSLKQYFPPMLQAETFNNYTDCFALRLV